jgi:3-keto-5-aminohexanoate cleavage enzyme
VTLHQHAGCFSGSSDRIKYQRPGGTGLGGCGQRSVAIEADLGAVPEWFFEVYENEAVDLRGEPRWDLGPVVIKAAITGAFFSRRNNPSQPYLPAEIAEEAVDSVRAGASGVHIHVRNASGIPIGKVSAYEETVGRIRQELGQDVVVDGCTIFKTIEKVREVIDAGLFETSPVNTTACIIGNTILAIPPRYQQAHAQLLRAAGVKAQIAVYTNGDIDTAVRHLIKPGLVEPPFYWIVVPALPGCFPAPDGPTMAQNLLSAVQQIRAVSSDASVIEVCAAGRASSYVTALAILLGVECVRVGKEDTIFRWPHRDDLIDRNATAVEDARALATALGREIATADQFRSLLKLGPARA